MAVAEKGTFTSLGKARIVWVESQTITQKKDVLVLWGGGGGGGGGLLWVGGGGVLVWGLFFGGFFWVENDKSRGPEKFVPISKKNLVKSEQTQYLEKNRRGQSRRKRKKKAKQRHPSVSPIPNPVKERGKE